MVGKTRSRRTIKKIHQTRKVTIPNKHQYLLCMPGGGLCDMMMRIYVCIEYCKKYNRSMILDTSQSTHAQDSIFNYFSIGSPCIYHGNTNILHSKTTYPKDLFRKIKQDIDSPKLCMNIKKSFDEDILFYRRCGRIFSPEYYYKHFLSICKLTPLVKEVYIERRNKLPHHYISVHIRNTDYKSDVDSFIREHSKVFKSSTMFLASDDYHTIHKFKDLYGNQVISFANIKPLNGAKAHHKKDMTKKENRIFTIDAIVDLLLLACGKTVYTSSKESGFSKVAKLLHKNPQILNYLLN
jgi:hypothetical protein